MVKPVIKTLEKNRIDNKTVHMIKINIEKKWLKAVIGDVNINFKNNII